jgi:hypothetical protein
VSLPVRCCSKLICVSSGLTRQKSATACMNNSTTSTLFTRLAITASCESPTFLCLHEALSLASRSLRSPSRRFEQFVVSRTPTGLAWGEQDTGQLRILLVTKTLFYPSPTLSKSVSLSSCQFPVAFPAFEPLLMKSTTQFHSLFNSENAG